MNMPNRVVNIFLPEEIAAILERDDTLKLMVENLLAEELSKFILKILALDKIAEGSKLTKEDIERLDKQIKRGIRLKIEAKISTRHK